MGLKTWAAVVLLFGALLIGVPWITKYVGIDATAPIEMAKILVSWPSAVVVVALLTMDRFREPLSALISKLVKVKFGALCVKIGETATPLEITVAIVEGRER